jgi:hypothetical protein
LTWIELGISWQKRSLEESWRNVFKIDPSGVEMVSSFVSISADEGVEMGFLTDFFSTACV